MYVDHLQLTDFRSYESVDLPLEAGVTTFVGANGQGKTNLVEAIEYLSTMSSHRVASELPLVRSGAARAIVRASVQAGSRRSAAADAGVGDQPGKANRARLNRSPLRHAREIIGVLARWCSRRWISRSSKVIPANGGASSMTSSSRAGRAWPAYVRTTTSAAAAQHPAQIPQRSAAGWPSAGATPRRRNANASMCGTPTWHGRAVSCSRHG